jgi:hypothetical protein
MNHNKSKKNRSIVYFIKRIFSKAIALQNKIILLYNRSSKGAKLISLVIILASIVVMLIFKFIKLNDNSLVKNEIHFLNSKNSSLRELRIQIYVDDYYDKGGDMLIIDADLSKLKLDGKKDNILAVSVNKNLRLEEHNFDITNKQRDGPENMYYYLNFKDSTPHLRLRFTGEIFSRNNQEINNSFFCNLDWASKPDSVGYPKTSFSIYGLCSYYNINIFPSNDFKKSQNSLILEYNRTENRDYTIFRDEGIGVSAEHKQRKYRNQIKSYLLTTVIGILISAITQSIIYYAKNKE